MRNSIKFHSKTNSTLQSGFSLLEVMIAMVIFAVGVLGLAGMQGLALKNSFESSSRSQAIILAYSMSDRILANPNEQTAYAISGIQTISAIDTDKCNSTTIDCTTTELVAFDQGQWKRNLTNQLLAGSGEIRRSDPPAPFYTIIVRWDEDRTGASGINCPPISATDLRCFQLQVQL